MDPIRFEFPSPRAAEAFAAQIRAMAVASCFDLRCSHRVVDVRITAETHYAPAARDIAMLVAAKHGAGAGGPFLPRPDALDEPLYILRDYDREDRRVDVSVVTLTDFGARYPARLDKVRAAFQEPPMMQPGAIYHGGSRSWSLERTAFVGREVRRG